MNREVAICCRKNSTGETRTQVLKPDHPLLTRVGKQEEDEDFIYYLQFELADNNWSCDCNRHQFFGEERESEGCLEEEYAIEWFSIGNRLFKSADNYGSFFIES